MVKQLILANAGLFGAYFLATGPMKLMYQKFFTLSSTSTFTGLGLCHFSHTDVQSLILNCGVLYTVGNLHAKRYGGMHLLSVMGAGFAAASLLSLMSI